MMASLYGSKGGRKSSKGHVPSESAFFPIDSVDEWILPPFPDESVCFRKAHLDSPTATKEEMSRAAVALREVDSDDGHN